MNNTTTHCKRSPLAYLACIFLLSGLLSTAAAQGIDIGIKAGFNSSQLNGYKGSENRTGLVGGLFAVLNPGGPLAIQPELLFVQKGQRFKFGSITLNQLSIPVLLRYELFSPLSLVAGPIFNFRLSDGMDLGSKYASLKDKIKSKAFELGAGIGVALRLPLGLHADLRYNMSLLNTVQNKSGSDLDVFGKNGKFRAWQFTIGYALL